MTVETFRAENVRCLEEVRLEPARTNLIYGENASGKTSLLEALFYLGRGRSFRKTGRDSVIRDGSESMMVTGSVRVAGVVSRLGVGISRGEPPTIRVDGKDRSSAAALAERLPIQVIDPDVHSLIAEGPSVRRRFMDWGLFHVEPIFLETWRRYQRAMKQRNAALRGAVRDLPLWDEQLVLEGQQLTDMRRRYAEALAAELGEIGMPLVGGTPRMSYRQGWPENKSLAEALQESRDRDTRYGVSHVGPHRADLTIHVEEKTARGRVSRGQQKLLAAALVIAQTAHLKREISLDCVLLLDDLPAELDAMSLEKVFGLIRPLEAQIFLTSLERREFSLDGPVGVFHVEQGRVRSMV